MKLRNISTLVLSAALGGLSFASAQEAAAPAATKLQVYVQLPKEKPTQMLIEKADADGKFYYTQRGTDQQMAADPDSCRLFFIQTPTDLADVITAYQEGDLEKARKEAASCRRKYAAFSTLPGNPASVAAVYELTCIIRLMDWGALAKRVEDFPSPKSLTGPQQARVDAAAIMANISDDAASFKKQQKAIGELLKDKKFAASLNSEIYSWLRYALGRATAAQIPADKQATTLSAEDAVIANDAIDNYCQCAMSAHGLNMDEIPADAMLRAMKLLWVMPGVQDYAAKAKAPMDAKTWGAAPPNFRDAVVMAYMLKNVYGPEQPDETVAKLAELYYNTAKDSAADK